MVRCDLRFRPRHGCGGAQPLQNVVWKIVDQILHRVVRQLHFFLVRSPRQQLA